MSITINIYGFGFELHWTLYRGFLALDRVPGLLEARAYRLLLRIRWQTRVTMAHPYRGEP